MRGGRSGAGGKVSGCGGRVAGCLGGPVGGVGKGDVGGWGEEGCRSNPMAAKPLFEMFGESAVDKPL